MNKQVFLNELKSRLQEYPVEETKKSLEYYAEMIDDRVEDGMTEAEAVASLGPVEAIVSQIKCELPLTTLVKQKTKEKTKGKVIPAWVIVLLVLGFPLWGSLAIVILAMILTLYALIWMFDILLWCIVLVFASVGIVGLVEFFVSLFRGTFGSALYYLGAGLAGIGFGIFLFFGTLLVTKGICHGTKWCFLQVKKGIVGKED